MIACIRLPYFAATVHRLDQPAVTDEPLILFRHQGRRCRVVAVCAQAEASGAQPGMSLSRARALCPEAQQLPILTSRAQQALGDLLLALTDFSARLEAEGDATQTAAVVVDLGRLYPEQGTSIAAQIIDRLRTRGFEASVGLAANRFTAHVAATTTPNGQPALVPLGEEAAFLAPLPVSWLPLDAEQARRLDLLGLRHIGQIAGLPRAALVEQFGTAGRRLHQLAQGLAPGADDSRIARFTPPVVLSASRQFDVALDNRLLIDGVLGALAAELAAQLDGQACRTVTLVVGLERGNEQEAQARLPNPVSQGIGLLRELQKLFDRLSIRSGVLSLSAQAGDLAPVVARQLSLFDMPPAHNPGQRLIDLAACYRQARFFRVVPVEQPLLELRFRLEPVDVA